MRQDHEKEKQTRNNGRARKTWQNEIRKTFEKLVATVETAQDRRN